jgi:peptidoglycan/LPS O-acetylase OafA/YrhL
MSTGRKIVGRVARAVVLLVVGFALFDVPAAYVASRGASPWLALAVGLAAFPIVALSWHVVRERARRRRPRGGSGCCCAARWSGRWSSPRS